MLIPLAPGLGKARLQSSAPATGVPALGRAEAGSDPPGVNTASGPSLVTEEATVSLHGAQCSLLWRSHTSAKSSPRSELQLEFAFKLWSLPLRVLLPSGVKDPFVD